MFSVETSLNEIYRAPRIRPIRDCLISGADFFAENGHLTLAQLQEKNPTWHAPDILYGLERLASPFEVHAPYAGGCPRLQSVKLTWLPAALRKHRTYVILLAGGAYGAVCTMVESLPVAARLNELGYDCFCLNYRTAVQESFSEGLLPEPIDDLAAALRHIHRRKQHFALDADDYALVGFSAGGHLASSWGTAHLGARRYGLSQPKCLLLAYPLITVAHVPDSPVKRYLCTGLFGAGYTDEDIARYDASRHIDRAYPPCYIVRSSDDATVSVLDGNAMQAALGERCVLHEADAGGHGFGLGTATPLRAWVERAAQWMEGL